MTAPLPRLPTGCEQADRLRDAAVAAVARRDLPLCGALAVVIPTEGCGTAASPDLRGIALACTPTQGDTAGWRRMWRRTVARWDTLGLSARFPDVWVELRVGGYPWSGQRAVLRSVAQRTMTVVASAHGAGKSRTAAWAVEWFVENHPADGTTVISTAPVAAQIRAILWKEIRRDHASAGLSGWVNQTEWKVGTGDLVAFGRKPSDHDEAAFQGVHDDHLLVVVDEAGGIPDGLWDDVLKLMTGEHSRLLAIGNPNFEGSPFWRVWRDYHGTSIGVADTPNFTDEWLPPWHEQKLRQALVTPGWVDLVARRYGAESAKYEAQVLGRFPRARGDGLIHQAWVDRCINPAGTPATDGVPVVLGLDIGQGEDRTVIRERRGMRLGRCWRAFTDDPAEIVRMVDDAVAVTGAGEVRYDSIGPGWAVGEAARARLPWVRFTPVNVAEEAVVWEWGRNGWERRPILDPSTGRRRFANLRAKLWWDLRELVREQKIDLTAAVYGPDGAVRDPDEDLTVADMTELRYHERGSDGALQIERKEDLRKRLGRSPDDGEAVMIAFAEIPARPPAAEEYAGVGGLLGQNGEQGRPSSRLVEGQRGSQPLVRR